MRVKMDGQVRTLTLMGLMLFGLLSIVASGDGDGGTDETTFDASSSGVAAKGIIQYGVVTAKELDSSGAALRTVGSAETDTGGAYSLSIGSNYAGGPLLLTITGKSDGTTKMVCDVAGGCGGGVSFGGTLPLDTTFSMTAIVPPVANGASISAQITPFTRMAARRVMFGGTVDADTVRDAISEVNQMVGINILEVPPVDITDPAQLVAASSEAKAYAAFVAGAGQLAFNNASGLQSGLDELAQSFEDGELTDTDSINPSELLAAVETEAAASGLDTDPVLSQVLATFRAGIIGDCTTGSCSYNPEPADTATQTAVEKARSVVAQTRAWAITLEGLETPLDAFGTNMDAAGEVLDVNSLQLGDTLGLVLDAVGAELDAEAAAGTLALTGYTVDVVDNATTPATSLGTATVTLGNNNGLNMTIAGTGLGGVDVALTATSNVPASEALALANNDTSMTLNGLDLSFTGSVSNAQASMSLDQMVFTSTFDADLLIDPNASTQPEPVLTSASLDGGLTLQASGARFIGTAKIVFVALSSPPSAIGDASLSKISLASIDLTGDFSDGTGNSFGASAGLKVNNAADFDTLGALACGEAEWGGRGSNYDSLGAGTYAATNLGIVSLSYASYDSWSGETCFAGMDSGSNFVTACQPGDVLNAAADFLASQSGSDCGVPEQVRDVYYYYDGSVDSISGELFYGEFESASNFANVTLTLTMDLTLTGYPDTTAVLTANRTALEGGDLTVTLAHDGQSITFQASKPDGATSGEGVLTVTTPDGIKLAVTATEDATTGTLKVGETTVGSVEETGSGLIIVRYSDGTFETLQ